MSYSESDLKVLRQAFEEDIYPGTETKAMLAKMCDERVTKRQVQVWFQNQRARQRKFDEDIVKRVLARDLRELQPLAKSGGDTVESTPFASSPRVQSPPVGHRVIPCCGGHSSQSSCKNNSINRQSTHWQPLICSHSDYQTPCLGDDSNYRWSNVEDGHFGHSDVPNFLSPDFASPETSVGDYTQGVATCFASFRQDCYYASEKIYSRTNLPQDLRMAGKHPFEVKETDDQFEASVDKFLSKRTSTYPEVATNFSQNVAQYQTPSYRYETTPRKEWFPYHPTGIPNFTMQNQMATDIIFGRYTAVPTTHYFTAYPCVTNIKTEITEQTTAIDYSNATLDWTKPNFDTLSRQISPTETPSSSSMGDEKRFYPYSEFMGYLFQNMTDIN